MKTFLVAALAAFTLVAPALAEEEKGQAPQVQVHIDGQVNKPGYVPLPEHCTLSDLKKACGGFTEFGSERRITVIRFSYPGGQPDVSKLQIPESLPLAKLRKSDGTYSFKAGDLIYIPVKQIGAS